MNTIPVQTNRRAHHSRHTLTAAIALALLAVSSAGSTVTATSAAANGGHSYQHVDTSNNPDNPRCIRC